MKYSFPAIIEKDKQNEKYYIISFPDLPCVQGVALGFNDALCNAKLILAEALKYKHFRNTTATSPEQLNKIYPNKKLFLVEAEYPSDKKEKTSHSDHYIVLKIVKSNNYDFNIKNVEEIRNALDKVVLYSTLLAHADVDNENNIDGEICKMLYDFKDVLIKEYSSRLLADEQTVRETINKIIEEEDNCFFCCKMLNMTCSYDIDECMCGFYSYRTIKKQLDELNCFDNTAEFAKTFLSLDYKIVGLKIGYADYNRWSYINE